TASCRAIIARRNCTYVIPHTLTDRNGFTDIRRKRSVVVMVVVPLSDLFRRVSRSERTPENEPSVNVTNRNSVTNRTHRKPPSIVTGEPLPRWNQYKAK